MLCTSFLCLIFLIVPSSCSTHPFSSLGHSLPVGHLCPALLRMETPQLPWILIFSCCMPLFGEMCTDVCSLWIIMTADRSNYSTQSQMCEVLSLLMGLKCTCFPPTAPWENSQRHHYQTFLFPKDCLLFVYLLSVATCICLYFLRFQSLVSFPESCESLVFLSCKSFCFPFSRECFNLGRVVV